MRNPDRIVVVGPKASGKSTLGRRLAHDLHKPFFDTDAVLEEIYAERSGEKLTFREIWRTHGEAAFRELERDAAERIAANPRWVVGVGGTTLLRPETRDILLDGAFVVLIHVQISELWRRVQRGGLPAFLQGAPDPEAAFRDRVETARPELQKLAHLVVETTGLSVPRAARRILAAVRG